jgi:pilus assembly protein CpaB
MNRLTPARLSMVMFLVVGGLISAYIAKGLFATEEKKAAGPATRNIPMAVSDLPAGTLITESHLGTGPALNSKVTRDVLLTNKVIVGRVTKEAITAAEPITSKQLYEKGVYPPLKVRKGMQAVTVSMGMPSIVDGLVKPGQFVDVHFSPTSLQSDARVQGGMTMTLFKGVKIIAINRLFNQGAVQNSENTVTLELSSEQANIILVAKDKGKLDFSFNPEGQGPGGLALTGKDRATLEEILGLSPIPKPAPAPPGFVTQIYRGANRRQYEFRQMGSKMMEWGGTQIAIPAARAPDAPVTPPAPAPGIAPGLNPGVDPSVDPSLTPPQPGGVETPDNQQNQQVPVGQERSV